MQLKEPGSSIILIGERRDECGGSAYYEVLEKTSSSGRDALLGSQVPRPDYAGILGHIRLVLDLAGSGSLLSCHDISGGGMLLALLEMTLPCRKKGGTVGISVDVAALGNPLPWDVLLFSETQGFLLEVRKEDAERVLEDAKKHGCLAAVIGATTPDPRFTVRGNGDVLVQESLEFLHAQREAGPAEALAGR